MSDVPTMFMTNGLKTALRVYARMEDLWGRTAEDLVDAMRFVIVEAFAAKTVSGLHFNAARDKRAANLTEERICGGIAINYGPSSEYDLVTNQAIGRVTRIEYGESQVDDVAKDLIEWLLLGKEPEEREQPRTMFERTIFESPDEESTPKNKYLLRVIKGKLTSDSPKPKGDVFTQDQVNRLTAISDYSLGEGEFISLHRQRYAMDRVAIDSAQLVLYNKTNGNTYALFVRRGDARAYCHGVYYGYPKCCIDNFWKNQSSKQGWWIGTGYMACKLCEDKPEQEIREGIASRRLAQQPFPIGDDSAESEVHFLETFCAGKQDPRNYKG